MGTIKLDDKEYKVEDLSEKAKKTAASLQFTNSKIQEITNMNALLQCAKNTYIEKLKMEMLSSKTGFHFGDE